MSRPATGSDRDADALAGEVLGVVLQRAEVTALVPARVDERLDAPELPAPVDAVQRERRAATAAHRTRQLEVPRDLAPGLGVVLVDLREGLTEDELGDLVRLLVLQAACLLVQVELALVRLGRVPEGLAVVVMEFGRIDRHDLEPVLALLEVLHDR